MNDSHLHIDPTSQVEVDYPGTRKACPVCTPAVPEVTEKVPVAPRKAPAKTE